MASTPHLYISALAWAPEESWISRHLEKMFQHLPLVSTKGKKWDASVWTRGVGAEVYSVAYSPDGLLIAVGTGNAIHLLDALTFQATGQPLEGHTDEVTSVAFSWDGKRITSASKDRTVRIWDSETRQAVGNPLAIHKGIV